MCAYCHADKNRVCRLIYLIIFLFLFLFIVSCLIVDTNGAHACLSASFLIKLLAVLALEAAIVV